MDGDQWLQLLLWGTGAAVRAEPIVPLQQQGTSVALQAPGSFQDYVEQIKKEQDVFAM